MVVTDNPEAFKKDQSINPRSTTFEKKLNSFDKHARKEFRHDFNVGHFANTTQEVEQTIALKPNL